MEKFKDWLVGPQFQKFADLGEIQKNVTETHYLPGAGALWMLAGLPGGGKTTFAVLNSIGFAQNFKNKAVGYFQWDFTPAYMLTVAGGAFGKDALGVFNSLANYYYSDTACLEQILNFCDTCVPGSLIVVDYIQQMRIKEPPSLQGHELARWAVRQLQEKALTKNIIILCLTSMNRSSMRNKSGDEDMTSGFGTSMIEFSADCSLIIKNMRRNMDSTIVWTFSCPKNRFGQRPNAEYDVRLGTNDYRAFFAGWDQKKNPEAETEVECQVPDIPSVPF